MMNSRRLKTILIVLLCVASIADSARSQDVPQPDRKLSETSVATMSFDELARQPELFLSSDLLDRKNMQATLREMRDKFTTMLRELPTNTSESSLFDSVLQQIANDMREHPEHFEAVAAYHKPIPGARAPMAYQLNYDHVDPAYRLAWEYEVLAPYDPSSRVNYKHRALEALTIIGDEASIPVLTHIFDSASRVDVQTPEAAIRVQQDVLNAMAYFPCDAGITAIQEAVAKADHFRSKVGPVRPLFQWKPSEFIKAKLDTKLPKEKQQRWQSVIDHRLQSHEDSHEAERLRKWRPTIR